MIVVIDYGAGNMRSIEKALAYVGAQVQVTDEPAVVDAAQAIVLPGVGSGGTAMARMKERRLDVAIRLATQQGKPFLGICLGMQLLADYHAEGEVDGLGLFRGAVRRIPEGPKIPHMGWNQVLPTRSGLPIFADLPGDAYFYFAHSYYVEPQDHGCVAAGPGYWFFLFRGIFAGHILGTPLHPQKSRRTGLHILT